MPSPIPSQEEAPLLGKALGHVPHGLRHRLPRRAVEVFCGYRGGDPDLEIHLSGQVRPAGWYARPGGIKTERLVHHRLQSHWKSALWKEGPDLRSLRPGTVQRR